MPLRVHTSSMSKMSTLSPHHHYIKCTVDQVRHRSSAPSFKCTVVRFYQLFCNRALAVPNHANHFSSSEIKHMILFLKKRNIIVFFTNSVMLKTYIFVKIATFTFRTLLFSETSFFTYY